MNINSKPSLKYNTNNMRKFLCEFIGTFTLVIFAAAAVMVDGFTTTEMRMNNT